MPTYKYLIDFKLYKEQNNPTIFKNVDELIEVFYKYINNVIDKYTEIKYEVLNNIENNISNSNTYNILKSECIELNKKIDHIFGDDLTALIPNYAIDNNSMSEKDNNKLLKISETIHSVMNSINKLSNLIEAYINIIENSNIIINDIKKISIDINKL